MTRTSDLNQKRSTSPRADDKNQWPPVAAGITLLLGALLFSLGNCGLLNSSASTAARSQPDHQNKPTPVRIAHAETRVLTKTMNRTGEVKAEKRAILKSRAGGTVTSVHVDLGDRVKAGQLLVRIDPGVLTAELRKNEAQIAVMESRSEKAQILALHHHEEFERRSRLHAEAALSATELAQAKIAADSAQADANLLVAEMQQINAELEAVRLRLADTEVRAPFAGKIAARTVDPGTTVSIGEVLLSLVSEGGERISFSIPESDVHLVRSGQKASVSAAGSFYQANIERIGVTLDPESRSLPVVAKITDETEHVGGGAVTDGARIMGDALENGQYTPLSGADTAPGLLPGMFVELSVLTESPPEAKIVPAAALFGKGAEQSVYVVDGEKRARATPVKLVFQEGEFAAVMGLTTERPIVVSGVDNLRDGQSVEAVP